MKKKQKYKQPNIIQGYDENGEISMFYWQKEPIKQAKGMLFKIPWYTWWNPIFRFNQWRLRHFPITIESIRGKKYSDI